MRRSPLVVVVTAFVAGLAVVAAPSPAGAVAGPGLYGLTAADELVLMNDAGGVGAAVAIGGDATNDDLIAIDVRPATGELYALGTGGRLYVVDPVSGAAEAVGEAPNGSLALTSVGFDFDPVVDQARVVSEQGDDLRINPDTGAISPVADFAGQIAALAFTESRTGPTATQAFGINPGSDTLARVGASLTTVGPLGVDVDGAAGLDITKGGTAIAVLHVGTATDLYSIDLASGHATRIAAAPADVEDIAFPAAEFAPAAVALVDGTRLVRFPTSAPERTGATVDITGLAVGETILGIDIRPATGELFGVSSASRLYVIDPGSGNATARTSAAFIPSLAGTAVAFDVNPATDRVRIVTNSGQNLRVNPDTGAVSVVDGSSIYRPGDPNANADPDIVGGAYTNDFRGTAATQLIVIDSGTDTLDLQQPPNDGVLATLGALGVDVEQGVGFDIGPGNVAFAGLTVEGDSSLFRIDTSSGHATRVGPLPDGTMGLALLPPSACEGAPAEAFADVGDADVHRASIGCATWYGITGGTGPDTFAPSGLVTRGQMASFIARTVRATGVVLPSSPGGGYSDVPEGHPHRLAILQLTQLGVVGGAGDGTFRPDEPVSRGQVATFAARAYRLVTGAELGSPTAPLFDDTVGSTHATNIDRVAHAGIVNGTAARTFSPANQATRAQMASIVTRLLQRFTVEARATSPA